MKPRYGVTAMALLVALGAAACGDDDPKGTGTAETSSVGASTSTATTSAAPQMTPEETVEAWFDARSDLLRTGDPRPLRSLAAPDCETCEWQIQPVVDVHQAGGGFQGGAWSSASVKKTKENADSAVVLAAVVVAEGTTTPSGGAEEQRYDEERFILEITLTKIDGAWRVSKLVTLR
ncbi:hypothetical protein KG112_16595 [Nocardioides sp. zg-ZUI104]|uniref:DUF6318 family protein n=1 Tax=Nocardioides faecalis TaxID=2803858 RepID=UPI001BCBB219|nr:DUF6318 family protein [Nocardioides faecalis]MBS4754428.1 hypothetical protein [Nocardioides faecalis]